MISTKINTLESSQRTIFVLQLIRLIWYAHCGVLTSIYIAIT